jgi:hypothetical protein
MDSSNNQFEYTCPCCGYPTMAKKAHSDMCVLCDWVRGQENMPGPSLDEGRENFKKYLTFHRPTNRMAFELETNTEVVAAKHDLMDICNRWANELDVTAKEQLWEELTKLKQQLQNVREVEDAFSWPDDYEVVVALAVLTEERDNSQKLDSSDLSLGEKIAIYVNWFDAEVANGGFHQFFTNSAGDYSFDILQSLKDISAKNTVRLFEKALSIFPEGKPSKDRFTRIDQLENADELAIELLSSLTQEYYDQKESIFTLAAYYLKERKSDFINRNSRVEDINNDA